MTFSMIGLFATNTTISVRISVINLRHIFNCKAKCHYAECRRAECRGATQCPQHLKQPPDIFESEKFQ
jgi:hypothetical protein